MGRLRILRISVFVVFVAVFAQTQGVNPAHPLEIQVQKVPSADAVRERMAQEQVKNDARELSDLCALVPNDIDQMRRGILPKDAIDRLKRVEKLSKRVREELTK
jgi:hypothetical protein